MGKQRLWRDNIDPLLLRDGHKRIHENNETLKKYQPLAEIRLYKLGMK